jgi:hypothetical protein
MRGRNRHTHRISPPIFPDFPRLFLADNFLSTTQYTHRAACCWSAPQQFNCLLSSICCCAARRFPRSLSGHVWAPSIRGEGPGQIRPGEARYYDHYVELILPSCSGKISDRVRCKPGRLGRGSMPVGYVSMLVSE